MQLYIYAKSGHNFGLENVRRASALCNMLQSCDPILCTADYRAATFAKQELGISKGIGIDIIGNLPNVMQRGDMLIYDDSGEASSTMQDHMKEFCTKLYKVGSDIPYEVIDPIFFEKTESKYQQAIFFADDDYDNWFLDFCKTDTPYNIPLVWGHYFFLGNEDKFNQYFTTVFEEDSYVDIIKETKYLLTSSVHTALESLSSGNKPIFFKRATKENQNIDLLEKYNIPVVEVSNMAELLEKSKEIIEKYPTLKEIQQFDIKQIEAEISKTLKLFEKISPSLDYKY